VLLNCGARVDLTDKWFFTESDDILVVLMDSHRPIYHTNVHFDSRLIVIEESSRLVDCPTIQDIEEIKKGDPDDEEEIFEANGPDAEKDNLIYDEEEDEDEDINFQLGKKRAVKTMNVKRQRQKQIEDKRSKIEKYYSGSYFSDSISGITYFLSRQLNQDNADFFWYWILGSTEMLVDKKIDFKTYNEIYENCKIERNRFARKDSILNKCSILLLS
jgi:hypothetical protein